MSDQPPLNRAQRRAQKFHRHAGARQDNLQTQRDNNSGFLSTLPTPGAETAASEVEAAGPDAESAAPIEEPPPDEGPTRSGAGTGGAVETAERTPHHEGVHLGNRPNS